MADMVSERYALSLYEVAQDEKQEKLYLDQLTEVCAAFDSEPDFLKMLTTPSIAAEDKQKVLKTVFEGRIEPFQLYLFTRNLFHLAASTSTMPFSK